MSETKEDIHKRMLSNISDEFDKTEGGFFYDSTKPTAIEVQRLDEKADRILERRFARTAAGEDLDKVCNEECIYRKQATKSSDVVIIKGNIGSTIKKGDLVSSDNLNYICLESKVIDNSGYCTVKVECEKEGSIGNVPVGAIKNFPITIPGLTSVTNPNSFTNGYDRETDESLRERYYVKIRTPGTSGNPYHYLQWALECVGVGDAKVFPLAFGPGTTKVAIVDSNKHSATQELIDKVFKNIEEQRPIGAKITVVSATEKIINISAKISIANGFNISQVQQEFIKLVDKHLKEAAFRCSYISIAKVGNLLLNTQGVIDYVDLKINNSTANLTIADEEIPVLGAIELGV